MYNEIKIDEKVKQASEAMDELKKSELLARDASGDVLKAPALTRMKRWVKERLGMGDFTTDIMKDYEDQEKAAKDIREARGIVGEAKQEAKETSQEVRQTIENEASRLVELDPEYAAAAEQLKQQELAKEKAAHDKLNTSINDVDDELANAWFAEGDDPNTNLDETAEIRTAKQPDLRNEVSAPTKKESAKNLLTKRLKKKGQDPDSFDSSLPSKLSGEQKQTTAVGKVETATEKQPLQNNEGTGELGRVQSLVNEINLYQLKLSGANSEDEKTKWRQKIAETQKKLDNSGLSEKIFGKEQMHSTGSLAETKTNTSAKVEAIKTTGDNKAPSLREAVAAANSTAQQHSTTAEQTSTPTNESVTAQPADSKPATEKFARTAEEEANLDKAAELMNEAGDETLYTDLEPGQTSKPATEKFARNAEEEANLDKVAELMSEAGDESPYDGAPHTNKPTTEKTETQTTTETKTTKAAESNKENAESQKEVEQAEQLVNDLLDRSQTVEENLDVVNSQTLNGEYQDLVDQLKNVIKTKNETDSSEYLQELQAFEGSFAKFATEAAQTAETVRKEEELYHEMDQDSGDDDQPLETAEKGPTASELKEKKELKKDINQVDKKLSTLIDKVNRIKDNEKLLAATEKLTKTLQEIQDHQDNTAISIVRPLVYELNDGITELEGTVTKTNDTISDTLPETKAAKKNNFENRKTMEFVAGGAMAESESGMEQKTKVDIEKAKEVLEKIANESELDLGETLMINGIPFQPLGEKLTAANKALESLASSQKIVSEAGNEADKERLWKNLNNKVEKASLSAHLLQTEASARKTLQYYKENITKGPYIGRAEKLMFAIIDTQNSLEREGISKDIKDQLKDAKGEAALLDAAISVSELDQSTMVDMKKYKEKINSPNTKAKVALDTSLTRLEVIQSYARRLKIPTEKITGLNEAQSRAKELDQKFSSLQDSPNTEAAAYTALENESNALHDKLQQIYIELDEIHRPRGEGEKSKEEVLGGSKTIPDQIYLGDTQPEIQEVEAAPDLAADITKPDLPKKALEKRKAEKQEDDQENKLLNLVDGLLKSLRLVAGRSERLPKKVASPQEMALADPQEADTYKKFIHQFTDQPLENLNITDELEKIFQQTLRLKTNLDLMRTGLDPTKGAGLDKKRFLDSVEDKFKGLAEKTNSIKDYIELARGLGKLDGKTPLPGDITKTLEPEVSNKATQEIKLGETTPEQIEAAVENTILQLVPRAHEAIRKAGALENQALLGETRDAADGLNLMQERLNELKEVGTNDKNYDSYQSALMSDLDKLQLRLRGLEKQVDEAEIELDNKTTQEINVSPTQEVKPLTVDNSTTQEMETMPEAAKKAELEKTTSDMDDILVALSSRVEKALDKINELRIDGLRGDIDQSINDVRDFNERQDELKKVDMSDPDYEAQQSSLFTDIEQLYSNLLNIEEQIEQTGPPSKPDNVRPIRVSDTEEDYPQFNDTQQQEVA